MFTKTEDQFHAMQKELRRTFNAEIKQHLTNSLSGKLKNRILEFDDSMGSESISISRRNTAPIVFLPNDYYSPRGNYIRLPKNSRVRKIINDFLLEYCEMKQKTDVIADRINIKF